MCTTLISVHGVVSFAITAASPLFLCMFCSVLSYFFFFIKCNEVQCNEWVLVACRNLSSLNLGGEISPSIGDLRNLQSMYAPFYFLTKPFYYVPNVVVIDLFFLIFAMLAEIFRGIS